jgi:hypothetical protein
MHPDSLGEEDAIILWMDWTVALRAPYLGLIDAVAHKGAADVPYPVFALLPGPSRLQRPQ